MEVLFLDLAGQDRALVSEIWDTLARVLEESTFILGRRSSDSSRSSRVSRGGERQGDPVGARSRAACVLPVCSPGPGPGWHHRHLALLGVETAIHYPQPIDLQPAYWYLGYPSGAFPVPEAAAKVILSLPLYPGPMEAQLRRVADGVRNFPNRVETRQA